MSDPKLSYSFDEWCRGHGFSRSQGYALLAKGLGPVTFTIGNRRQVSFQADADWIKRRERETAPVQGVARLEAGKAVANAKRRAGAA